MQSLQKPLTPNPRDKANIFSILTFWWTIDLFKKGYRKVLELEDLYTPIKVDHSESLGDRLERKWREQCNKVNGKPSLTKAVLLTFWREYLKLGVLCVCNDIVVRLGQPIMLGNLLLYFRSEKGITHEQALWFAGGIAGLTALTVITLNQYILDSFHIGMKVRVAVCSIIYRKSLRLSRSAIGDTAPGKIVNLLSNDVNRFDMVTIFLHSMWSAPLLTIVVGYFLWVELQWAGMVGICIVFIVVPVQSYTGKLSSRFRLRTALRTDERVRFMDEVISGVQVIKMYAWEKPFSKLINYARKMELKIVRKSSYVRGLYMTFMLFTTRMALFCTMLTLALNGQPLTASQVFVVYAYFSIISSSMSQMFVRGIAEIAEVLVALKRLQAFLEYSEKDVLALPPAKEKLLNEFGQSDLTEKQKLIESESHLPSDVAISIKNASARWNINEKNVNAKVNGKSDKNDKPEDDENSSQPLTLDNINIEFKKGILIGVVGSVGAGKSSLLQIILRELPLISGSVVISGKLSYAGQEPWVFNGTVKQNIIFGQEMNRDRYDDVVKACALLPDFEQFPHGDKSLIGERGASLSGGQRARINLARAVYRKADTYILDDPLSAVDAHVGRHLFDSVIGPKGRLSRQHSTRILVTHQVHYLKEADWIVALKDGKIELQGSPLDLSKSGIDIATLLEVYEPIDEDTDSVSVKGQRSRQQSTSRSINSSLHSLHSNPDDDSKNIDDEKRKKSIDEPRRDLELTSKGTVKGSVSGSYFRTGAHPIILFGIFLLFVLTQIAASAADFWVSFWTSQEELRRYYRKINETVLNSTLSNNTSLNNNNNNTNTISSTIANIVELFTLVPENSQNLSDNSTTLLIVPTPSPLPNINKLEIPDESSLLSTELCMYIHGALVLSIFIIGILRSITFYSVCVRASQKLHFGVFKGLISTSMRFFDTNPSGRILNRFSKDLGSVDEYLPKAILDASQIILNMFGAIIVTTIVNPIFLVPIAVIAVIFLAIRRVYLKSSKNIKRLEGITRSPVFTHLAATLTGLSTIRVFNAESVLIEEFDGHQDLHSASWYMFITVSTAFGFSLDLLCLLFISLVTFSFLVGETTILGDKVGLAITQSLALTGMMQWGIRQSAEVANNMMSVERLLEYRDLEPEEEPKEPRKLVKEWPAEGQLEFKSVIYRYFEGAEPVLRELSFVIFPQEKIGIVGRTGAGKSSLIGAIFRLARIEGQILIDGIETSTISLESLRSKVSIIPQDPVLFSGTLRRNLDPFEEYPDISLWTALEEVELKDIAGPLGLQSPVLAGGSNFSVGQRQLLCLARAILRNNKILVLDEATANVDPHTDSLIQKTIRKRFAECTVLTVAHRLNTIMDSDRVLVMADGRAEEFATPYVLLQQPNGVLSEMVKATGPQEAERLLKIARETYESKKKN